MAANHSHNEFPPEFHCLSALIEHPQRVATVPSEAVPLLIAELAAKQATLSAVQGLLSSRLVSVRVTPSEDSAERLLTAEEVARALGVTKRWVQRRARRLPFARQLSEHAIRYSETGLRRWMARRQTMSA